jgi:hypothetical protein
VTPLRATFEVIVKMGRWGKWNVWVTLPQDHEEVALPEAMEYSFVVASFDTRREAEWEARREFPLRNIVVVGDDPE